MALQLTILDRPASTILTAAGGFIAEAGFTHTLSPASGCRLGCAYCYVPTLGLQGGIRAAEPDSVGALRDTWGAWLHVKSNAADLLRQAGARGRLRDAIVYCSPLTELYQPELLDRGIPAALLDALAAEPPRRLVIQTRSPLILGDLDRLVRLAERTSLGVSFSLTTDREDVRRALEPRCAPLDHRLRVIARLRSAGLEVFASLAPLLPSGPDHLLGTARAADRLVERAIAATANDMAVDPLHVRQRKARGATTWEPAWRVCRDRGWGAWLDPQFQDDLVWRIRDLAAGLGYRAERGPAGFGLLRGGTG